MKNTLFAIFAVLTLFGTATAQKIDRYLPVGYTKIVPSAVPNIAATQLRFNTANSSLYKYNRNTGQWETIGENYYAEMGISNDTLSISFAGTTPDTLEGLTSGDLSGFAHNSEGGVLTYNGTTTKRFLVNYSTSFTFAEAVVVNAYIVISGTIQYPTRTRNLPATAGNTVSSSGSAIITLTPGQTVSLFFVPASHTGTDALTVYEANVTLTEIK